MPDAVGSDDSSSRDGARAPSLRPPEPLGSPPQESDCSEAAGERDGAEDVEEGSGAEDCAVKLGAASSDTLIKNAGLVELSSASSLRDVRRETSTVKASLYVSELRQNGFAVLVSDCHHVLSSQALLPSDCQQGDGLRPTERRRGLGVCRTVHEQYSDATFRGVWWPNFMMHGRESAHV